MTVFILTLLVNNRGYRSPRIVLYSECVFTQDTINISIVPEQRIWNNSIRISCMNLDNFIHFIILTLMMSKEIVGALFSNQLISGIYNSKSLITNENKYTQNCKGNVAYKLNYQLSKRKTEEFTFCLD